LIGWFGCHLHGCIIFVFACSLLLCLWVVGRRWSVGLEEINHEVILVDFGVILGVISDQFSKAGSPSPASTPLWYTGSQSPSRRWTKRIRHRVWIEEGKSHHIVVSNQGAEIPRRREYKIAHPGVQEATDRTVVGDRNQPNHVQRGRSKAGLEKPPICQYVEGTMGWEADYSRHG
jgi:hypothetical protein